jgi:signal transduction histidine kinase
MKLTKKQQAEILKVYNAYWDGYLKGDIASMAALLDPKYTQVGSAETEVFFNKKDAVKFLHDTIDQVAGQLEMRKRVIRKEWLEASVLINEQCDLYAKSGRKWIFFSKFRASTTLHEKSGKWKIIHQHSSFPDLRAQDGENIAIEKIEEENLKLKDAIKRRTIELEEKNRELEIETALERVRTVAMAMSKPDDLLNICEVLFKELYKAGFKDMRCALIHIFNEEKRNFDDYDYSDFTGGKIATIPYKGNTVVESFLKRIRKSNDSFAEVVVKGKALAEFLTFRKKSGQVYDKRLLKAKEINYYFFSVGVGNIGISNFGKIDNSQLQLLKRFRNVFNLSYQRYTDIAKAEAQAREAEIELALERVRARTMAMQNSDELAEASFLLDQQVRALGIQTRGCAFNIYGENESTEWFSSESGTLPVYKTPRENVFLKYFKAGQKGESLIIEEFAGKGCAVHYDYLCTIPIMGEALRKLEESGGSFPTRQIDHVAYFKYGYLLFITLEHVPEAHEIFKRFAKVFEQTYTRFLDLQKAEAQTREAQIEAALERVRSKSLAMHKSEEILDVCSVICEQFTQLGLEFHVVNIGTNIRNAEHDFHLWIYSLSTGKIYPDQVHVPYIENPIFIKVKESLERGEDFFTLILNDQDKKQYYQHLFDNTVVGTLIPEERKTLLLEKATYAGSFYLLQNTLILVANYDGKPFPEEHNIILKRFGNVFEQSYTRFLDLQKAEAQTREAQIEAALERVRSRTMAMHKSEELTEVASLLFKQVQYLGIKAWTTGFNIWSEDNNSYLDYVTDPEGNFMEPYTLDTTLSPALKSVSDARKAGKDFFVGHEEGEELRETYRLLLSFGEKGQYEKLLESGFQFPTEQYEHFVFGSKVSLLFITYQPVPEAHNIFKRFGQVFEQTYTRFLDLQKAEAQAREATIEASLERVRGKAMAMHSSDDLAQVIRTFYDEFIGLSKVPVIRLGAGLLNKENYIADLSTISKTENGDLREVRGKLDMAGHPMLKATYEHWLKQTEYHHILRGNEIKEYYQFLNSHISFPNYPKEAIQHIHFPMYTEGSFYVVTEKELAEDELQVYRRFTSVLSLTYKRYKDLKDAEAREKDAIRQASLDRVRAEIASMRTVKDLERITPLIWRELTTLGIPFVRCGVFIIDTEQQQIHTFLSTPDGKAIAAAHQSFEAATSLREAITAWQEHKTYVTRWVDKDFQAQADVLMKQGAITSRDQYLSTIPKEGIYLHFLPFLQGMLYVGNTAALHTNDLNLVHSVADAFSTAYARYEDFNKLEAAKQQVDKTLVDLKQAQQQLVQAEKMASLGELTAGIAHEIQNPLNFVNNFSEVSNELIDEMKTEQAAGNWSLAAEIADDVKQNMEKILHHGKRAEGIVKGMLQHSRSSSGVKEPTDINALCDEYLRLSYHGLRAKDKSFNAKFETDFDSSLPRINVAPQDIGRVILNLINNAFYAVNQQRATNNDQRDPLVRVSTKNHGNKIEISVKDNGNGIPQDIVDKIFQPFFTTKPTGQGTGLGLSLSYDIVKVHGGEFKVETKDGEGSQFIIQLPLDSHSSRHNPITSQ